MKSTGIFSPKRRDALKRLIEKGGVTSKEIGIPRWHGDRARAPLSFAQERLWLIDQIQPGNAGYNMPSAYRLGGTLNIQVLERSLNEVVRRHEVLRTSFQTVDEQPVQVVTPHLTFVLSFVDLADLPETQREQEALRLAVEEAQAPFDLAIGPLLRGKLLRTGPQDHILLLTMHHIISDGWSIGVLGREVIALYAAFSQGRASPLPELSIQYVDFAVWQREWLQGERLEKLQTYWRQHLADMPVLELPTDHPRPKIASYRGANRSIRFSQSQTEMLKTFSNEEGVSLFMVLLAGFLVVLARYTGQQDIAVRSPVANRTRQQIEALIGYFVNILALRTDLSGNPTFRELVHRVSGVCQGAYAHQDLPFEQVMEDLHPVRRGRGPLFPVMFTLQNYSMSMPDVPDGVFRPLTVDHSLALFDLTVTMTDVNQELRGNFNYNTDLFEAASIQIIMEDFQAVLESAVLNPGQRLDELGEKIASEHLLVFHSQLPDEQAAVGKRALVAPRTETEKTLAKIWQDVLGVAQVDACDNFFELGGDSLLSIQVIAKARQEGVSFTPKQFFQHQTLAELAASASAIPVLNAEQGVITGPTPLSPPQAWLLRSLTISPERFSETSCFEIHQPLNTDLFFQTLQHLLIHHDILRARFTRTQQGWQQVILPPDELTPIFAIHDFSTLPSERHNQVISQIALELQNSHNFSKPPLIKVAHLKFGPQLPERLLISVHHLIMDAFSMGIIFKDLQSIYAQLSNGKPVSLPPKTIAFKAYAESILHYARTVALPEVNYWLHFPWERVKPLPMDMPENRNLDTYARAQPALADFSVVETQSLLHIIKARSSAHTQITDFLLTALALAFKQWKGLDISWITFANTGRSAPLDHLDLSRTVGWIGTTAHFLLDISHVDTPLAALNTISQQIGAFPAGGLGYELLTYLVDDPASAQTVRPILNIPKSHALFNYMGNMFAPAPNPLVGLIRPGLPVRDTNLLAWKDRRFHPLEISGAIKDDRLIFNFLYGPDVFHSATIETLAGLYRENLLALIKACQL